MSAALPLPVPGAGTAPAAPAPPSSPVTPEPAKRPVEVLVDVVALTADMDLFQAARDAVGERNPTWRARSADEAADLLITGRCGVLLIDMACVSVRADTLIEQIVEQFPDVVVCVAGTRADEPLLAPLISNGLVYRFLHKPASARRAGMFLQAAIKRHVERRDDAGDVALASTLRAFTRPDAGVPRRYFLAFALTCAVLVSLLFVRPGPHAVPEATPVSVPPADLIAAPSSTRADPILSRARAALQGGRLEAPAGRNALDLFEAVLLAQPEHVEARAGLDRTIDLLLERARNQVAAGRRAEAERLLQRVLSVEPQHAAARALVREVSPPDLPSRQLAREQVAEVRAQATARAAEAAVLASRAPRTLTPRSVSLPEGPLPEPVSSAWLARQASKAPEPAVRRLTVAADPLTPRYVNAPEPVRVASWRKPGRATPSPARTAARDRERLGAELQSPAAHATVPVDEFERVAAPDPVYPPEALRTRTTGWVELEFTITPTGGVSDIDVVGARPIGVFEAAASAALAQWRFRPRVVNGQAAAERSSIRLRFDVDG